MNDCYGYSDAVVQCQQTLITIQGTNKLLTFRSFIHSNKKFRTITMC